MKTFGGQKCLKFILFDLSWGLLNQVSIVISFRDQYSSEDLGEHVFGVPFIKRHPIFTDILVEKWATINIIMRLDFQQCGILTCVDSDGPGQPPFKLRNSK